MKKKLIQLTPDMAAWLEAEGKRQGMPVNVLIRVLIAQAMKKKA